MTKEIRKERSSNANISTRIVTRTTMGSASRVNHSVSGVLKVIRYRKNPTAMQFCKKYDVDLVFHACKDMMNSVRSTLLLSFENPAKSKFLGFLGSRKDKIELSGYGNAYDTRSSLKTSTNQLMDYMLDSTEGKPVSGVLNSHIKLKEEQIADTLFKKELAYQDKLDDCADCTYKYEDLDTAIKDLIESSK